MEISDIRRRLRMTLEQHRKASAERRARADEAAEAYRAFLHDVAVPLFRVVANVAKAEGYPFTVYTPAEGVRLVSERNERDFVEIWLDTSIDPPKVGTRISRQRGRDLDSREGLLRPDTPLSSLQDEDVLAFLLGEIGNLVER
ncbi:MAG TPA: hypothetical protein VK911_05135 [Vicinamibacterales bacterium]|nr:hypothetical protein [Vicinamibacterales bacterium]